MGPETMVSLGHSFGHNAARTHATRDWPFSMCVQALRALFGQAVRKEENDQERFAVGEQVLLACCTGLREVVLECVVVVVVVAVARTEL